MIFRRPQSLREDGQRIRTSCGGVRAAAVALAALAACSSQQIQSAGNRALSEFASQAPRLAAEGALGARIEANLAGIDPNSALHVALGVHGGSVTLSGKVASDAIRTKYIAAVKGVPGVRSLHARLAVDPSLATTEQTVRDFALVAAVRARLAAVAGGNGLGLRVTARNGTVTVSGSAQNAGLKATELDAVRRTGGVRAVVDLVRVER